MRTRQSIRAGAGGGLRIRAVESALGVRGVRSCVVGVLRVSVRRALGIHAVTRTHA
jgi:hypothetical protein